MLKHNISPESLDAGYSRARSIAAEAKVRISELEAQIRIEKLKQRSAIAICDAIAFRRAPEPEILKPRDAVKPRHSITQGDIENWIHDAANDEVKAKRLADMMVDTLLRASKTPEKRRELARNIIQTNKEKEEQNALREQAKKGRIARENLEIANLRQQSSPITKDFVSKKFSVECPVCPKRFFFAHTHNEKFGMGKCENCGQNWCVTHNNAEKPAAIYVTTFGK